MGVVVPVSPRVKTVGGFAPVIPLPKRWARAKHWIERNRTGRFDGTALHRMRELEHQNRG